MTKQQHSNATKRIVIVLILLIGLLCVYFYIRIPSKRSSGIDLQKINRFSSNEIIRSKYSCPNYQYTTGTWTNDTQDQDYHWVPTSSSQCTLEPWSIESFCEVLNGRSILVVGDSVSANIYRAMITAFNIAEPITEIFQWVNNHTLNVQQTVDICSQRSRMTFIRNDWLTIDSILPDKVTGANVWTPWLHTLKYHEIVVLNTGAHTRDVTLYEKMMNNVQQYLRKNYNGTVIYRTTPRGHINCSKSDVQPIASTMNNTDWDRFFTVPTESKYHLYHYGLFPEYNEIMKRIATPAYTVIDLAPILELRPDIHIPPIDCLHLFGSALKIWMQLLLNALHGTLDNV